jgi:hypothetical protein
VPASASKLVRAVGGPALARRLAEAVRRQDDDIGRAAARPARSRLAGDGAAVNEKERTGRSTRVRKECVRHDKVLLALDGHRAVKPARIAIRAFARRSTPPRPCFRRVSIPGLRRRQAEQRAPLSQAMRRADGGGRSPSQRRACCISAS